LGGLAGAMAMVLLILFVGAVQTDGASPLYVASEDGHVEVVQVLLGAGADVGQATVSRGCSVAKCVGYGAVRRAADVVCDGMCVFVVWLCEVVTRTGLGGLAGAMAMWVLMILFVGTVQAYSESPLFIASCNGHVEVVRALLEAGADVGLADVSRACSVVGGVGYGAVRQGTDAVCGAIGVWFGVVRCWRGLVGWVAGAMAMLVLILYVGAVQWASRSPLVIASENGHVEVVRALLGAGADVCQATVSRACSVVEGVGYGAVRRAADAVCDAICVCGLAL
jgi:hypothetical protein